MKKRVTIKDIAKKAGVSHPTVSRVISDHPRISETTKRRVRKIMADLDYQPDLVARGLVRRKSQVIACIVPDLNPHVQPILRGVADACRRNGYGLMLSSTEYWTEEGTSYMDVVDNWRVDGVLIYNVVYHKGLTKEVRSLQKRGVPFVFINKYLDEKAVDTVSIDNRDAVFQALEYLAGLGHKRIGMLKGSMMSVDGVERHQGYCAALAALGLPYDESVVGEANFSDREAYEETRRLLHLPDPPTALFCANDLMAMGAIQAIRDRGLRVPEDVSVVGFDDIEAGQWFKPTVSTLRPPLLDVGGKALDLLVSKTQNPERAPEQVPLKAKLVIRESSGPCP